MSNENKSLQVHKESVFGKIKDFFKKMFFRSKDEDCKNDNVEEKIEDKTNNFSDDLQNKVQKSQEQERLNLLIKKDKETIHSLTDEEIEEMINYYKNYVSNLKRNIHSKELELKKLESKISN